MSLKALTFTRRTFLGGMGATIAATTAYAAAESLLQPQPLEVAALVDGQDGCAALTYIAESAAVYLRTTYTSSRALQRTVDRRLMPKRSIVTALDAPLSLRDISRLPSAMLLLGRWNGVERNLLPLITNGRSLYIDDPVLAKHLAETIALQSHPEHSLIGFTSVLDPAVEHAGQRLRSGVMGKITEVAVSTRSGDLIGPLEAAAALHRLTSNKPEIKPRLIHTRNVKPSILIACSRGQLAVPLYSKAERLQSLPLRLELFAQVARGQAAPAVSLTDMLSLPVRA